MAAEARERLDVLVVERGLSPSREQARALIMAGQIHVNGQRRDKPGERVPRAAAIEVAGETLRFASRGGLKLEKALDTFGIDCTGRVCLDVGASTGGFTDCMLSRGAVRVYAVDVGYGQLDYKLRQDPRVMSLERVNARNLGAEHVPEPVSLATVDVSFISLAKVLPAIAARLTPHADLVALVKPQFEAGRADVGKGGVVKDPAVRLRVVLEVGEAMQRLGLGVLGCTVSPIKGPAGNVEFLLWAQLGASSTEDWRQQAQRSVDMPS
jgi:23S rRNA (cytidine1920-2'-O)/16S rRNA (cytidine1409-2'-O)-methyltransferase